jgi:predicted nuclease of predicted toxin-antitoxin system
VKLLLDNGLPRSAGSIMRGDGEETVHVGEIGLAAADDDVILAHALDHNFVVVTLDADFHTLLALRGASCPSVIRSRIEGLKGPKLVLILRQIVQQFNVELTAGAVISVGARNARCHLLPLR